MCKQNINRYKIIKDACDFGTRLHQYEGFVLQTAFLIVPVFS